MSLAAWIVLGLIAGFIGSKLVDRSGRGIFGDILLGVVGAMAGGFLFHLFGSTGVTGVNPWSMLVAVVGSVVVLAMYNTLFRRSA
jgi:uncharacterized membrane protein YeaQ/YmgE (transglycosylase-associated protein family)